MVNKIKNNQKGYIILMVTFFVLIIMVSIATSISFLTASSQKNATNNVKSTKSYYASEAGIEDALFHLKKIPQISSLDYELEVDDIVVEINIPSTVGISKTITAQADNGDIIRNIKAVASLDNTQEASFYYGVEVGGGGLIMNNGSRVMGNVFSGGNISGGGTIDNNVVVSGNGHSISGVRVKGDALVYSCLSSARVDGDLTYVQGGSHACTVYGSTSVQTEEIAQQPLPIPQSQIDDWKTQAESVGTITGNVSITNGQTRILGPVKITGSLTISNNATLKMTGTVYVVGNITISNNATVRLDSSYGSSGGVLISDGNININNNVVFLGSGQQGSYLLVLSNSTSDSAIDINNNTSGAVFYTSAGTLRISNNVSLVEATGYKVVMENNSTVQYSSGIVHIYFSSGTGGGWEVSSWQEQ